MERAIYSEEKEEEYIVKKIEIWNEETIEVFNTETNELKDIEKDSDTVEERWEATKEIIKNAVPRKEIKRKIWKIGTRRWWDRESQERGKVERAF